MSHYKSIYFKWKLLNRYQNFCNDPLVRMIRESFLYNLCKAMILILLTTFVLFRVTPNKAYIYAELEQVELASLDYQAQVLTVDDILSSYLSITSFDKIIIALDGLSMNSLDFSNGDYLEITPIGRMPSELQFFGAKDDIYFYDAYSNVNQYKILYSDSASCRFIGEQHVKILYATAYIVEGDSGERTLLDTSEELVLINSMTKDIISKHQELIEEITENDGSIRAGYESQYQNYLHTIDRFCNEEAYSVRIATKSDDPEAKNMRLDAYVDYNSIRSECITSCTVTASGILRFSYLPLAEEYVLKKQELYLSSDDSSLNLSYDINSGTAYITGYVTDAQLSQMDLFPNFWNWYFSNIYLAPLTLISTVLTTISMINKSKKSK